MVQGNADYIPNFGAPQLFRWSGYWVEITRSKDSHITSYGSHKSSESLQLMSVIEPFELYAYVNPIVVESTLGR